MSKSGSQSPQTVAKLLERDYGPDGAEEHLQSIIADFTGETQERALAVLGELRKMQADSDPADGDACSALGCRATERLRNIDGRVLCEYCAIEYQQRG